MSLLLLPILDANQKSHDAGGGLSHLMNLKIKFYRDRSARSDTYGLLWNRSCLLSLYQQTKHGLLSFKMANGGVESSQNGERSDARKHQQRQRERQREGHACTADLGTEPDRTVPSGVSIIFTVNGGRKKTEHQDYMRSRCGLCEGSSVGGREDGFCAFF